jgi:hypothetical protein
VWTALSSDIGAGFIKGLTGHEPAYWSELAGVEVGDFFTREAEASAHDAEGLENAITNQTGATIIVESTKSFLQKDVFELTGLGLHPRHIRDAYEARNEFYEACLADTQVRGIGFTDAEEFPIKRSDFARLHVALSPKEQEPDERPWHVAVDAIKVTSPNWARDDKQRQWKGRDSSGRERHFKIEDEEFWQLVAAQQLDPHIFDTMKVQWAFRSEGGKLKDTRVLRVLEYNDNILAKPLDDNALNAILGQHRGGTGGAHRDLFAGT